MYGNARAAYLGNAVTTASPARLLVMLFERLTLDVQRAVEALETQDLPGAHEQLVHAQDIVTELRSTLRTDVWDGAAGLLRIYDWLSEELLRANLRKDAEAARGCLPVVTELTATWRQAALANAAAS